MQAHTRRAVTRQYLALPMEWHQRHPTGQLLSNANSDVEAAWGPIAPLPMALGTVVMMVIAVVQMFLADVVMALVGALVFPAVVVANLAYQRRASPLITKAQQLRAELSEVAHESFDGAMVVKTLGRESEETARFADMANRLRDINIRAGRVRAAFDPTMAALPNLGVLVVLAVGVARVLSGATDAGDVVTVAFLLTIVSFPIRSIGWLLGEFPRSVVGYDRVRSVLDATGEMPYGDSAVELGDTGSRLVTRLLDHEPGTGFTELDRVVAVRHLAGRVQDAAHAVVTDHAARELAEQPADRADREGHDREQERDGDDIARVGGATEHPRDADREHHQDAEVRQRGHRRVEGGADPAGSDVDVAQPVRHVGEPAVSSLSRPRVLTTIAPSKDSCATSLSSARSCWALVISGDARRW